MPASGSAKRLPTVDGDRSADVITTPNEGSRSAFSNPGMDSEVRFPARAPPLVHFSEMRRRVLILNNAIHRFLFKPHRHWQAFLRGVESDVVNIPSGQPMPPLNGCSHLILTGSEASIMEPKPWYEVEANVVREAVDRGLAILGSCFGHQLLVHTLSGPEYLRKARVPEIGWTLLEIVENDRLLTEVPSPWSVFSFHFDEVASPPAPWKVLARSAGCPVHVARYGDLPIWGMQAHPEIAHWKAEFLIRLYLLLRRRAPARILDAYRRPPRNDRAIRSIVLRFLESADPH